MRATTSGGSTALTLLCIALLCACSRATPDADTAGTSATTATTRSPSAQSAAASSDADPSGADAPASTGVLPLYRQLRDFTVACDNGLRCETIGVSDDGSFGLVLRLSRDAGPDGAQQLRLDSQAAATLRASLRLDGKRVPALEALPWRDDDDALVLDDPAHIARFLALVGDGTRLTSGDGAEARVLSLAGLHAALLLIDEHQQRLDTPGAWQRRGERDPATVPPAPALPRPVTAREPPVLADADAKRLVQAVRTAAAERLRAEDCDTPRADFDITGQDGAWPLDARDAIVLVACRAGAYQTWSYPYRIGRDGNGAMPLELPSPPGLADVVAGDGFESITEATYDPGTGTLSHAARGRGLADCGESADWRFDGTRFVLSGYAALRRCGGAAPGDWPVLWRVAD